MKPTGDTFRTMTGTCTVARDRILLVQDQWKMHRRLIIPARRVFPIYVIMGVMLLAYGVWAFMHYPAVLGGYFCFVGALLITRAFRRKRRSPPPIIDRSSIRGVTAHPPRALIPQGRFMVEFLENGRRRKCWIVLPGRSGGGLDEYEWAVSVMQGHGLLGAGTDSSEKTSEKEDR